MNNPIKQIKWTKKNIIILVIVICFIILASGFTYYNSQLSPVSSDTSKIYFSIESGDNLNSITQKLDKKGLIKNASLANIAGKLHGDTSFNTGTYILKRSMSTTAILNYLSNPKNIVIDQVMLTFKEGIWAKDIAKKIGENTNVKSDELINLWNDDNFLNKCIKKYDFLSNKILNSNYRVKLEGYLYPETYYFKKNTSAEEVTYTFLNQFQSVYNKYKKQISESKYSIHELITLASVVQYESKTENDMKMIAGVFYNRLNKGMKLQSSVTVCYAIYNYSSWQECEAQTDIDSPYNTYQNEGLPIGPILNPGEDAIKAVLNPTKNDYYYFIADVNGDGTVYYAKTFEEHQANINKYLNN